MLSVNISPSKNSIQYLPSVNVSCSFLNLQYTYPATPISEYCCTTWAGLGVRKKNKSRIPPIVLMVNAGDG